MTELDFLSADEDIENEILEEEVDNRLLTDVSQLSFDFQQVIYDIFMLQI